MNKEETNNEPVRGFDVVAKVDAINRTIYS